MKPQHVAYRHRQTGWVMLGIACMPFVCLAIITAFAPAGSRELPPALLPLLAITSAVELGGFSSMDVVVTDDYRVARFGLGIVRKTVPLAHIVRSEVVETRWYEGWGIHWTRRGMLWNVSGFDAVRVELDNGRALMIGSDEARRLQGAISAAIAAAITRRR